MVRPLWGYGAVSLLNKPGSQIAAELPNQLSHEREEQILNLVRSGNYVLNWTPLVVERNGLKATFWVSGDSLRLGTPEDSFRVATMARTHQRIADELNAVMPTALLSDEIYRQAHVKLVPKPQGTSQMSSMTQMIKHHNAVEKQLDGKLHNLGFDPADALIAPVGKDWINSRRLLGNPTVNGEPAAINYGWHRTDLPPTPTTGPFRAATGYPPLVVHQSPGMAHDYNHQDYSQVVRLVSRLVKVCQPVGISGFGQAPGDCIEAESCTMPDGTAGKVHCMDIYNVAKDPVLHTLLSHNGPVEMRHFAVPYELPVGQHHAIWGGNQPTPPPPHDIPTPPAGDHPPGPTLLKPLTSAQAAVGMRVGLFAAGVAAGWWIWKLGSD